MRNPLHQSLCRHPDLSSIVVLPDEMKCHIILFADNIPLLTELDNPLRLVPAARMLPDQENIDGWGRDLLQQDSWRKVEVTHPNGGGMTTLVHSLQINFSTHTTDIQAAIEPCQRSKLRHYGTG